MIILLSGSSGFIGSHLRKFLETKGHRIVCLVRDRHKQSRATVYWDPVRGEGKKDDFEGFDAVIHLAGASIVKARWTKKVKETLFLSRCRDTWLLSQIMSRLYQPPKTFISASAIGYYGDRGEEELTEKSSPGEGFLSDLCKQWEKATEALENRGSRLVHARFGTVLSPQGGMLAKLIPLFRLGLGGKLGSGKQIMSWISLRDLLASIHHCLIHDEIQGSVNVVAPEPVRQEEFARQLAQKLHRPSFLTLPAWLLKLAFGQMAKELLLSSQKVVPEVLLNTGYTFADPDLAHALSGDFFF